MLQKIIKTDNGATIILIRLVVGAVFLSEGIQKFLFADKIGAGRFEKIGLLNPEFLGPFVGGVEITCGSCILIGLLTRVASIEGFWTMAHESRTDWAMLLSCIFLLIKGGGRWSVDRKITNHRWT